MTDHLKENVYGAEQTLRKMIDRSGEFPTIQIYGSNVRISPDLHFGDIPSVQRYVDGVLKLNWVRAEWERATHKVTVRPRKGNMAAHYELNTIAVPANFGRATWAMREIVILHELSHHFNLGDHHGMNFIQTFVKLVEGLVSEEDAFILKFLLREEGISI